MANGPIDSNLGEIREVAAQYCLHGAFKHAAPYGSGHINDTYAVVFDQAGTDVRYILQRINHNIFKDVPLLMSNLERVTKHLAGRIAGGSRSALTLVPTNEGHPYCISETGNYWRLYLFIEKARTYDELTDPRQAYEAAKAFGLFQCRLTDLPGKRLQETIAGFHDTRKRFEALAQAASEDCAGRRKEVAAELDFALRRQPIVDRLLKLCAEGAFPERITHNDTKINNVMLDDATGEGICVIDLDTVMPGLSLYDFGDMVRTACSPAAEDEKDLSKITVRMPIFEALTHGFAAGAGPILTDTEWENLPFAGRLMTFEVGIRFLADYLSGDVYFKTKHPRHNLDRCRAQFRLVECIEEATPRMDALVSEVRAKR